MPKLTRYVEAMKLPIRQRDFFALIDDCDARLAESAWYAVDTRKNRPTYVMRMVDESGRRRTELLHRIIMKAPPGVSVDHINGDALDNRRENLRFASKAQNAQNAGPRQHSKRYSQYKGVTFHAKMRKWYAYIQVDKKRKFLGHHDTPELCAKAYDAAAKKYFGAFARLNFPLE